ncbi:hypothetical protein WEI85_03615 [Actinomycetes bacterium KLBMP 9797]
MPPARQPARHRAAAATVAAFFVAAPFFAAGAAHAAPTPTAMPRESGKEVVFSGKKGLLGVACEANPSTSAVTVPAESTLQVINRTGYRAKLILDGAAQGEIADGGTAPVVFHRGPVTLGLKPSCMIGQESAVRVEVTAAPGATSSGTGTTPGAKSPARPGTSAADDRDRPRPHASSSTAPASSPSPVPSEGAEGALTSEDSGQLTDSTATVDAASGIGMDGAAAEALASVEPVRESGPIGLLALIATVCAVGASAGAIRAIIAQRASRTGVA